MKKRRYLVAIVSLAIAVTGCGTSADSDVPPELTSLPPVTAAAVSATTTTTQPQAVVSGPATTIVPNPPPTTTPPLPTTTTTPAPPTFAYTVSPVTAETVWASWNEDCPLHFDDLSLLTLTYWNLDGNARTGPLVISTKVVDDVVAAF
ncbi:MAG: hypothetical protein QNL12_05015, partial [Acidimicrobiia bacterium]|nr:hypothetical protein [Acidimicrobiia bacterium]MDX2466651.1 hypothetical protein [Acidimicrobiia bacterium]